MEPLRSVQEMLHAWIFIKLPFRNHMLLRVWALTLIFRTQTIDLYLFGMFLCAYLPEKDMRNDLHDLVSGWRE